MFKKKAKNEINNDNKSSFLDSLINSLTMNNH